MSFINSHKDGVTLRLRVQTRSSRPGFAGLYHEGQALKWGLKSPPVEGKANEELIESIAKTCGVAKSEVDLLKGETSREKVILVRNRSVEEIRTKLEASCGRK